jgi:hypothetical protein
MRPQKGDQNHKCPTLLGRGSQAGDRPLAARELGRLRIVRNYLTKANPWLCTGCPDVQHRLKLRRIVQRGETDGQNSWSSLAPREQRRATIGAKARNWRARAYIADRSACTPAGKWNSHVAVSSCRLTRFHWHLTDDTLEAMLFGTPSSARAGWRSRHHKANGPAALRFASTPD